MFKNKSNIIWAVVIGGVIVGGFWWINYTKTAPNIYDSFAQCLGDKGAKFYGTFWCPYCNKQKAMFGSSAHRLPYVECSTADRKNQLPVCRDKNITGYPTWEFADGSRENGVVELKKLAEKTGCELPAKQ